MEEANEASAAENDARSVTVVGGARAQGLLERCALFGVFEGGDEFGDGLDLRFGGFGLLFGVDGSKLILCPAPSRLLQWFVPGSFSSGWSMIRSPFSSQNPFLFDILTSSTKFAGSFRHVADSVGGATACNDGLCAISSLSNAKDPAPIWVSQGASKRSET